MTVSNGRVDFRLAKQIITMQMLLDRYNITRLRKSGDERVGECPICHAQGKRQFKANIVRNVFRCFVCNAQGDIIAFVKAMESCASLADAGVKLRELFPSEIAAAETSAGHTPAAPASSNRSETQPPQRPNGVLCFLVFPADDAQPTNERAAELLDALPWINRVSVCVQSGTEVIEAVSFTSK